MPVIETNTANNYPVMGTAMQNFNVPQNTQPAPAVAITTPQGRQVYQYPQTSIYNDPAKQAASGLNIFVFNPSGISNAEAVNNTVCTLGPNAQPQPPQQKGLGAQQLPAQPIANTSLKSEKVVSENKKTKNVVKLTDDYIKTLESFLRSQDTTIRKQGVLDLVKRFEEDDSRYDNESLTALLNIALQDPDVHNRMIALSVIASGNAHGDNNTIQLLNNLTASDKMYGQEAKMATNAILKTSQIREKIVDNSPEKQTPPEEENNGNIQNDTSFNSK